MGPPYGVARATLSSSCSGATGAAGMRVHVFPEFAEIARIWPTRRRSLSSLGRAHWNSGQLRPNWAQFGRFRPTSAQFQAHSAKLGRDGPNSGQVSLHSGRSRPNSGQSWPESTGIWVCLGYTWDIGQSLPDFCCMRPDSAGVGRTSLVKVLPRPKLDRRGPESAESAPNLTVD